MPTSLLFTLMITIIIDVMGLGLVLPILPNLVVASNSPFYGNHAVFFYGLVLSVWSLGGFFGSPFLGSFSDKIGRKKILITSLSGNAIVYALTAFSIFQKFFWLFIFLRFCSGFFSGSFEIAQAAVADKSTHLEKAKNMSFMNLAFAFGFIIGPLLSSLTVSFGIIIPFLMAAGLSCLNVFFLSVFFSETHVRKECRIVWSSLFTSFTFIFRDPRVRNLGLVFLLFQCAWGFYFQAIPLVLQEKYYFTPKDISYFFILLGVGLAFVPLFLQKFMMRYFSLQKISFMGLVISGIFISLSFLLQFFIGVQWIVALGFPIFESLAFGSLLAMLSNRVSNEEQGKMMGGCGALYAISFIFIGLSIGVFSSFSIWVPIIVSAIFFFVSGSLLQVVVKK
ncbi:MAG: MFS transporter [Chlamydiae bacterium]|nr:MFS transporter [Chlamydiota bacterium]